MKKTIVGMGVLLAFGFLAVYATSVYIHRNDNRFKFVANSGAIDTRTGQACLMVRSPDVFDAVGENPGDKALSENPIDKVLRNSAQGSKPHTPFCGDIK